MKVLYIPVCGTSKLNPMPLKPFDTQKHVDHGHRPPLACPLTSLSSVTAQTDTYLIG